MDPIIPKPAPQIQRVFQPPIYEGKTEKQRAMAKILPRRQRIGNIIFLNTIKTPFRHLKCTLKNIFLIYLKNG